MDCSMPSSSILRYPWSLLKFMSIESVMLSNHLIFCSPSPFAVTLSQHQGLFQWVGPSHQGAKNWSFSISPSNEYSRLISFRIDWFDLLLVQGTLKSLLQHCSSKTSILWCSALLYCPALTSVHDYQKNHSFDCTDLCRQSDVFAF